MLPVFTNIASYNDSVVTKGMSQNLMSQKKGVDNSGI